MRTTPRTPGTMRGNALPAVLVGALVMGILGAALMDRTLRSSVAGCWSQDHLVLRMLAESAVEELHAAVQKRANTPADPVFEALRSLPIAPDAAPVNLDGLELGYLPTEFELPGSSLGGELGVQYSVAVRRVTAVSGDPLERCGILSLAASVELARPRQPMARERVLVEHSFRVSRVTPPRPLDQVGLLVAATTAGDLRQFRGRPAFALARGEPHTLLDLMTHRSQEGFQALPAAARGTVARALRSLAPAAMARRAHMIVTTQEQLRRLLAGRLCAAGVLAGVLHCAFTDAVALELPAFRGTCLLSFTGPVEVKDVTLEDPRRDSLTIVSARRVVVTGRRVEASLVCTSPAADGLVFQQRAEVHGAVVSRRFPRWAGLDWRELGGCRFAASPEVDQRSRYLAAFSPAPVAVQHARDEGAWIGW